jgi:hypothetical protein
VADGAKQWPIREVAARVEDKVWPLLALFTDSEYARRFAKEGDTLTDDHCERVANGILQAREYFQAASHTSLATAPVLLYYGILHLANVLIAASAKPQPDHHGLTRLRGDFADTLDYFGCNILLPKKVPMVFASLNEVVDCDINIVPNPLGKGAMVLPSTMAMVAYEYPQRDDIIGSMVQLWDIVGSIPELHEYCVASDRIECLTVPLHQIKIERRNEDVTVLLAFSREIPEFIGEDLRSTLGMEEWVEGRDVVVFRAVSKEQFRTPLLRSPLRGQPHILAPRLPGSEWQISEVATMLLAMFILGDLARYQARLWMHFISGASIEVEAVRAFVDIAASKFPFLVLNHLRREFLRFAP